MTNSARRCARILSRNRRRARRSRNPLLTARALADFKVPRLIRFDTDLPGEDSGKIMKRKLRALLGSRGAPNLGERSRINRLHTVRANVIRK
jgi:acyl-coenzyme A synthetase/AMP-(fatty) acid ligase